MASYTKRNTLKHRQIDTETASNAHRNFVTDTQMYTYTEMYLYTIQLYTKTSYMQKNTLTQYKVTHRETQLHIAHAQIHSYRHN